MAATIARTDAGAPLAADVRGYFERAFESDLSKVRIHDGAGANAICQSRGAMACARANDLYFRPGLFEPRTRAGRWLLAHELAHVLQQRGSIAEPNAASCPLDELEREANRAAFAVMRGERVTVKHRANCPEFLAWGEDMHFLAVYWTGRMQGAPQRTAIRVALASESLDDHDSTAADKLKIKATLLFLLSTQKRPESLGSYVEAELQAQMMKQYDEWVRFANNAHTLGVSFEQSEAVARAGIAQNNDLLFGLGMHTVGDYLAHANLSGGPTVGHQNGHNQRESQSWMLTTHADRTIENPDKALDTIARFSELWANFLTQPVNIPSKHAIALKNFVLVPDDAKEEKCNSLKRSPIPLADAKEACELFQMEHDDRHAYWRGAGGSYMTAPESAAADTAARVMWLSVANDSMFRKGKQDVSQAWNKWGSLGQMYPYLPEERVCRPILLPRYDRGL